MDSRTERRAISGCHPGVLLLYFLLLLGGTVCLMHPVCLAVSLGSAVGCCLLLRGRRGTWESLRWIVPTAVLAAGINPLLVHRGDTVLAKLPWGSPLTLESLWYGLAGGAMLGAVLLWAVCWNQALPPEKVVYLVARPAPALALVLSMTLSFVPRLRRQLAETARAQAALPGGPVVRNLRARLRRGTALLSGLTTWSLERSLETGDAMRSRGYGLPGRTSYAYHPMTRRDKGLLLWLLAADGGVLWAWAGGGLAIAYYPRLTMAWGTATAAAGICCLALGLLPLALEGWEELQWNRSITKKNGAEKD